MGATSRRNVTLGASAALRMPARRTNRQAKAPALPKDRPGGLSHVGQASWPVRSLLLIRRDTFGPSAHLKWYRPRHDRLVALVHLQLAAYEQIITRRVGRLRGGHDKCARHRVLSRLPVDNPDVPRPDHFP